MHIHTQGHITRMHTNTTHTHIQRGHIFQKHRLGDCMGDCTTHHMTWKEPTASCVHSSVCLCVCVLECLCVCVCVCVCAWLMDILSPGNPSLFHLAMVASSVSMETGSRPSVMGIGTWKRGGEREERLRERGREREER